MPGLAITTLGSVQILHKTATGTRPVTGFESDKVRALLIYLAVERARAHPRTKLAALLWPHMPEARARANLRQALSNLRAAVGDRSARTPFLRITHATLQWEAAAPASMDYWEVDSALQHLAQSAQPAVLLPRLACALHGYQGDFLADFRLDDAPDFEEWQHIRQVDLQQRYLAGLDRLADAYLAHEANNATKHETEHETEHEAEHEAEHETEQWSRRQLQISPTHEAAHRRLIQLHLHMGDWSAAATQFETCRALLHQHLRVEPSAETAALYAQVRRAAPAGVLSFDHAGAPAALSTVHHLPSYATPCLGRAALCAQLIAQLTAPATAPATTDPAPGRITVIMGPGGMGKTRLAVEVLQQMYAAPHPPNQPAYFMSWAELTDPAQVWTELARTLGIALTDGETPERQVLAWLAPRAPLLLLDNLDSMEEAAHIVQTLLEKSPGVRILATSRRRLDLRAEIIHELAGLDIPSDPSLSHPESLPAPSQPAAGRLHALPQQQLTAPAVALFVQTAQRSDPHFYLTPDNTYHVAAICRLAEGMPLAIELAAGWVRTLSCAEIHASLRKNLDLLAAPFHDLPPRHRSIRATFNGTWLSLSPGLQTILRRMSVLRGPFDGATAQAIAGADPAALHILRNAALVRRDAGNRYSMHELLRQFAHEKLRASPDFTYIQREHAQWFAQRLAGHGPADLLLPAAVEELLQDLPNLQAGARYGLAQGHWSEIVTYAEHLGALYMRLNRHQEARQLYSDALEALNRTPVPVTSDENLHALAPPIQRARWQRLLGETCYRLGLLPISREHIIGALTVLDATGARVINGGKVAHIAGISRELLVQARALLGVPCRPPIHAERAATEAAHAYERLGQLYYFEGRPLSSLYTALRGVNLAEGADAPAILSRLYANLALAAGLAPFHPLARHYGTRAERSARHSQNPLALIWALELRGMYALGVGEWERARAHGQEAAQLAQKWGVQRHWEESMALLASVDQAQGKLARACQQWQELAQTAHNLGHQQVRAWGMSGEAECLLLLGDPAGAKQRLLNSLDIHQEDGDRLSQASDHGSLALACWQLGEQTAALEWGRRALQLFDNCEPTAITAREGYCALAQLFVLMAEQAADAHAAPPSDLSFLAIEALARRAVNHLANFARVFPIAQPRAALWRARLLLHIQQPPRPTQARRVLRAGRKMALRLHMLHEVEYIDRLCTGPPTSLHLNSQTGD